MSSRNALFALIAAALLAAVPAKAQENAGSNGEAAGNGGTSSAPDSVARPAATASLLRTIELQNVRPLDQRGLNMFEFPKEKKLFTGFKLDWGAAFTQQMQSLSHSNAATPVVVNGQNQTELADIGTGFNNANANLYMGAQLAPGIRVAITGYMSSRHHPEFWMKDGYLLVDESPIDFQPFHRLMEYVTLRMGHFELNYGDAHFRRSDNGNALFNPFVGNYIMDAFTTEIGGEVYVRAAGLMAMGAVTGGEIRGNVTSPDSRAPSYIAKLGVDRQLTRDLRTRLTGSLYTTEKSVSNTLYGGDRAGSRYYWVMERTASAGATEAGNFTSGLINPGMRNKVTAYQINPFVKFQGLELFGVAERAEGRAANETVNRVWNQYAADVVYRFLKDEKLYLGGRYNTVNGPLPLQTTDVSVDRYAFGAGWFITPSILMKAEYVNQKYHDFPAADIRHQGRFNGFMVEGVVAF